MASMSFTIFNISSTTANTPRLTSVSFPQKASRVCFTSASKHSQKTRASGEFNAEDAKAKLKETQDGINKAAGEFTDGTVDGVKEATEKMKESVAEMKGKVENMAGKASEDAEKKNEQLNVSAKEAADKAGEDTTKAVDFMTEAKDNAIDAAGAAAEKTKQAVEGAWEGAKEALEKK